MVKAEFTSKIDRLSRTKTFYRGSDSEVPRVVPQTLALQTGPPDFNSQTLGRSFDKRFRYLEAKIDHITR